MVYVALALLIVAIALGWTINALGWPGNWLMVGAVAIYALCVPGDSRWDLSWTIVAVNVFLALLGEAIETLSAAWGIQRRGGSRRAAVFATIGSLCGAILGAGAGIPVPIIGSLIGAVLGAAFGALGGAVLAESSTGRSLDQGLSVGWGAFWGRLAGTLGKIICSTLMVVTTTAALIFGALA